MVYVEENKSLTAITLSQPAAEMKSGEALNLSVDYMPSDTTDDKAITWSSSNALVAEVSKEGKVTAKAPGTAVISAKVLGLSASCTVTVKEEPIQPDNMPFIDVGSNEWYYNAIQYVYVNNIMKGLDSNRFAPGDSLARAQFSIILHRLNGEPAIAYSNKFKDVPPGVWYTNAILWANSINVVNGYSDSGLFGPGDKNNREQMAVMMYRYATYKGYDMSQRTDFSRFLDGKEVNLFAKEAMEWAVGSDIITGKDSGSKRDSQGNASRAECATIIMRFMERYK